MLRFLIARTLYVTALAAVPAALSVAFAADIDHSVHDAHTMEAHAGHTGAAAHIHHQHPQGAWMLEYRFMRMSMNDLLDGTDSVNPRDIAGALPGTPPIQDPSKPYRLAPTGMDMDMHMLMFMYGWTSRVTLMAMTSYRSNEMDLIMPMPATDMFGTMKTDGLGDSLVGLMINASDRLTTSLGLGIPTGGIDEFTDITFRGVDSATGMPVTMTSRVKAGYPMQLGSGTWDLTPSITYAVAGESIGGGLQASYTWRIGENDNDYTLGNVIRGIAWAKHAVNRFLLATVKLTYSRWGRIDGQDPELNPALSPTTDPKASGGTRMDLGFGLNAFFSNGHAIGLEFDIPVYQDLNGPQMEADWMAAFVYQYM